MTNTTIETIIQPLIKQQIFSTPVEAAHVLVQDYIQHQIQNCGKKSPVLKKNTV